MKISYLLPIYINNNQAFYEEILASVLKADKLFQKENFQRCKILMFRQELILIFWKYPEQCKRLLLKILKQFNTLMTHSPSIKNNRKVVSPSKKFAHNNCKHSFYFSGLEGGSKERVIWRDFFLLYTVQWARKFKKTRAKKS